MHDYYNWDTGKSVDIGPLHIEDPEMQELHRAGLAQEYEIEGTSPTRTVEVPLSELGERARRARTRRTSVRSATVVATTPVGGETEVMQAHLFRTVLVLAAAAVLTAGCSASRSDETGGAVGAPVTDSPPGSASGRPLPDAGEDGVTLLEELLGAAVPATATDLRTGTREGGSTPSSWPRSTCPRASSTSSSQPRVWRVRRRAPAPTRAPRAP